MLVCSKVENMERTKKIVHDHIMELEVCHQEGKFVASHKKAQKSDHKSKSFLILRRKRLPLCFPLDILLLFISADESFKRTRKRCKRRNRRDLTFYNFACACLCQHGNITILFEFLLFSLYTTLLPAYCLSISSRYPCRHILKWGERRLKKFNIKIRLCLAESEERKGRRTKRFYYNFFT